jgi:hypothetical protein
LDKTPVVLVRTYMFPFLSARFVEVSEGVQRQSRNAGHTSFNTLSKEHQSVISPYSFWPSLPRLVDLNSDSGHSIIQLRKQIFGDLMSGPLSYQRMSHC